jgi:hypothetical protein
MKSNRAPDNLSPEINNPGTDFLYTNKGPIARLRGIWYSVNGSAEDIMDVRYALKEQELLEFGIQNESDSL